jgi:hypothetical protein
MLMSDPMTEAMLEDYISRAVSLGLLRNFVSGTVNVTETLKDQLFYSLGLYLVASAKAQMPASAVVTSSTPSTNARTV